MWKFSTLIADDDAAMRGVLKAILPEIGAEVVDEAADGQEALGKYVKHSPHLVLLDVNMPKMSGIEALRQIRIINPKACIIMLTSESSVEIVRECIRSGARAYVLKTNPPDTIAQGIADGWSGYVDQMTGVQKQY
jgi:two-component system chemotaxis response regulator CheY